jgi:hypothetical protein
MRSDCLKLIIPYNLCRFAPASRVDVEMDRDGPRTIISLIGTLLALDVSDRDIDGPVSRLARRPVEAVSIGYLLQRKSWRNSAGHYPVPGARVASRIVPRRLIPSWNAEGCKHVIADAAIRITEVHVIERSGRGRGRSAPGARRHTTDADTYREHEQQIQSI